MNKEYILEIMEFPQAKIFIKFDKEMSLDKYCNVLIEKYKQNNKQKESDVFVVENHKDKCFIFVKQTSEGWVWNSEVQEKIYEIKKIELQKLETLKVEDYILPQTPNLNKQLIDEIKEKLQKKFHKNEYKIPDKCLLVNHLPLN